MPKRVIYTDERGWKRCSLIPDQSDESEGRFGIPLGPPDLRSLDWEVIAREINNELVDRGVLNWRDVQESGTALMVATTIVKRHLVGLYKQDEKDIKDSGGNPNGSSK